MRIKTTTPTELNKTKKPSCKEKKTMTEFADKRKDVESIDNLNSNQFQEFLDTSQYEMNKILR